VKSQFADKIQVQRWCHSLKNLKVMKERRSEEKVWGEDQIVHNLPPEKFRRQIFQLRF
jgi:hypothetical protein